MREIIIVTRNLANDGATRVQTELIGEWCKECKVILVLIRSNEYAESFYVPDNVEIIKIEQRSKIRFIRRWLQFLELKTIIKNHPDSVIVSMLIEPMLLIGMCSPFIKNRIVFSERNDPRNSPPQKIYRIIRNRLLALADACVFQTEEAKGYFSKQIQKKSTIISNPINKDIPLPHDGKRRNCIVAVGRLTKQKNIPMLLNAFKMFNEEYPDYRLEIYGRGELENDISCLISNLGLKNKVSLQGYCEDIYEKMIDCMMYVSSSDYEGISNSMLEAMSMGIPTICTDCPVGGARMIIENGYNGLLVPVGNSRLLYKAMKTIIEDTELRTKLSINACKVKEKFPVRNIAKEWMKEIFEL